MLLAGGKGSGKTGILNEIETFFAGNQRCGLYTETISCGGDYAEKSTLDILTAFSAIFRRAEQFSPSLIILDDLEKVCPSISNGGTEEKINIVSLHLFRLMQNLHAQMLEDHNTAFNAYHSMLDSLHSISSDQINEIVAKALHKRVFSLASSESADGTLFISDISTSKYRSNSVINWR
mmetsp:Transcript_4713/g.7026  ORF Transcript_4713/g.7026 Transcript_4713/m.7026 type:complete len:178 (+) Transcript_4713:43-576(+)